MEHYSDRYGTRILSKMGNAGPLFGALLGCIPQCGFSVAAANLYTGGLITLGTLLAVFLSTSDEAVVILLARPGNGKTVLSLIIWKVVIGITAGFLVDLLLRHKKEEQHMEELCKTCGCKNKKGLIKPALHHAFRLSVYLFFFTFFLNLALAFAGTDRLGALLGKNTPFQPFLAALIGMIPNCASSVLITELYLVGSLNFGAAIAGLSAGAGAGPLILLRTGRSLRENLKILLLLYGSAVAAGLLLGGR